MNIMATVVGTSVQIPVELALGQAISQANELKRLLQQNVKPDSSAYREISGVLDKIIEKSQAFKTSMNESFKTSTGTKKFSTDMSKMFELLNSTTQKLSNISTKDLLFSQEDEQRLRDITNAIQQTQQTITQLKKDKINGFFDDSSISEFKQVQEVAKKLQVDLSSASFSSLQKAISNELNQINSDIEKAEDKINDFNNAISNANLRGGMLKSNLANAAQSASGDLIGNNVAEVTNRLTTFYNELNKLGYGQHEFKIDANSSVASIIEKELDFITNTLDQQTGKLQAKIEQYRNAIELLRTIRPGSKNQSKDASLSIFNQIQQEFSNLNFDDALKGKHVFEISRKMREVISAELSKIEAKPEDLQKLKTNLSTNLANVFSNLDFTKGLANKDVFKESIKKWLESQQLDLSKTAFNDLFKNVKVGDTFDSALNSVIQGIENYINQLKTAADAAEQERSRLLGEHEELSNAGATVSAAQFENTKDLQTAQALLEQLKQTQREFGSEQQKSLQKSASNTGALAEGYNKAKAALEQYSVAVMEAESRERTLGNIKMAITNWMGFNQVMNLVKNAVTNAMNHIKELDTTMNGIAIVTNMTTGDLWKQVGTYSDMAQAFGTTIQGAYEVSKIYYQAGYETNEVLTLTNETLKLAKVSGLDYATTTNYMMNAMRGFKMEMEDASRVVDVYSNLAANTAVSQQELAEAMSKTASSMESVGSSFEETSAMIATMVAVTRESAVNIGSALKSIASRYGEMKADPSIMKDAEGEALSYNKVDAALQSVGISLKDTEGQFRSFTEVIRELAGVWDELDSTQQRYIATQFAGNRLYKMLAIA